MVIGDLIYEYVYRRYGILNYEDLMVVVTQDGYELLDISRGVIKTFKSADELADYIPWQKTERYLMIPARIHVFITKNGELNRIGETSVREGLFYYLDKAREKLGSL